MDVMAYAQNSELTEMVGIPGSDPNVTRVLPDTLQVLWYWYQCYWLLHWSGFCLRGQFGAHNVLVYSNLAVRLTGIHLVKSTKSGGDMDYEQFMASAEQLFMLRESMPSDITTSLELIRGGIKDTSMLSDTIRPLWSQNGLFIGWWRESFNSWGSSTRTPSTWSWACTST